MKEKIISKKESKENFTIIKKKKGILDVLKHLIELLKKAFVDISKDTKYIVNLRIKKG